MFIEKDSDWYLYGNGINLNYKQHKFSIKKSKKYPFFYLNIFRINEQATSLEYFDIECIDVITFRTTDEAKSKVQKFCENL